MASKRSMISCLCVGFLWPATGVAQKDWTLSLHGKAFAQYSEQGSERGGSAFNTIGWGGAQLQRGGLGLHTMISLDPLTLGDCGYPRLLAGAGLCQDHPFEDRGHRHPLFMELSATIARHFKGNRAFLQAGLAGEPTIGAVGYMHRAAAELDPIMPLTHHDINPAHVVNGFATAGVQRGALTLEASAFNSELDADPYDLDLGSLESFSGRLRYDRGHVGWQFSAAQFNNTQASAAHAAHAATSSEIRVFTSSAHFTSDEIATTLAWSRHRFDGHNADAFLGEAMVQRGRHALMARAETTQRMDVRHTDVELPSGEREHVMETITTRVSELAGVYALRVWQGRGVQTSLGMRAALTFIPEFSRAYYDTSRARSLALYASVRKTPQHEH